MCRYLNFLSEHLAQLYHKYSEDGVLIEPKFRSLQIRKYETESIDWTNQNNVYIYPCIQIPEIKIQHDTNFAKTLYSSLSHLIKDSTKVLLCTSYFNIPEWFQNLIIRSNQTWKILTSHPKCSSFFNASGNGSHIPELYKNYLHKFVNEAGRFNGNIQAFEYANDNETFHAKGMMTG